MSPPDLRLTEGDSGLRVSHLRKAYRKRVVIRDVTMRLDRDTVAYFKAMAEETGIPYQSLINLYLRDCAVHQRKLKMKWAS